ncbi:phosphate transport system regulatory protein PhoU [Halobacteriovorax sp. DA5]|nr:phosphate transport system regulatory protein PhoU [Halobacteriovorax sp. DA5]
MSLPTQKKRKLKIISLAVLAKEHSMELTVETLRKDITEMAAIVEKILHVAVDEKSTMENLYELENEINEFHKLMDDHVFKFIALKSPTAIDLRTALAIMKINSELERLGDEAVNLKRYLMRISNREKHCSIIQAEVFEMVRKSLIAFASNNIQMATDVIKADHEVNSLHRDLVKKFYQLLKDGKAEVDEGFAVIRVSKIFERCGDHATNICEDIIFLESGKDVRHTEDR